MLHYLKVSLEGKYFVTKLNCRKKPELIKSVLVRQHFCSKHIQSRSSPVGKILRSGPEGLGSRLARRKLPCTLMAPVHVKSVVRAMFSKFPSKLYLWGYQIGGVIPSGANQNFDDMSPDHPLGCIPDRRQYRTSVTLVRR